MKFVNSFDGNQLRYLLEGDGETCLVFIPGLSGPLEIWNYQRSFSSKYKTLFVELAGHGKSGTDRKKWSMTAYAKDVIAIVESLNLTNLILIGHSMGGSVMLETAKLIPNKVIGLIGVDTLFNNPYYSFGDPDKLDEFMEEINISEQLWRDLLDNAVTSRMDPNKVDPTFVTELIDLIFTPHLVNLLNESIREMYRWDFHDFLEEIDIPIRCIVAGETVPEEDRDDYKANFPTVVMEGLHHFLFLEEPDKFNRLLEKEIHDILADLSS